jgi:hypothetical protein
MSIGFFRDIFMLDFSPTVTSCLWLPLIVAIEGRLPCLAAIARLFPELARGGLTV